MSEVKSKIIAIIEETLGKSGEEIDLNADFGKGLNADSLDKLELILAIEEEFDILISDEDLEKMMTVKSSISLVEKYLNHKE